MLSLRRTIKRLDPPVIISFIGRTNILSILACKGIGKRIIISEASDPARQNLGPPWNNLRRFIYNHADVVTANTHSALKTMESYVNKEKLVFLPNPIIFPGKNSNIPKRVLPDTPIILSIGRLHPQKAHNNLLNSFARLPSSLAHWRLWIIGEGEEAESLREQASVLEIADRIDWYGQVSDPFVYYNNTTIFVLVSRYEGMSNALMEAMSCGLPAIVTDSCPGSLELVTHKVSGMVVPFGDIRALAKAIVFLAENPLVCESMGDEARKRVADYELPKAIELWERVIGF